MELVGEIKGGNFSGEEDENFDGMTPRELLEYLKERLQRQKIIVEPRQHRIRVVDEIDWWDR